MKKVLVTRFEKDEDDNDRLEENDADDEEEDVEEEGEMWHDARCKVQRSSVSMEMCRMCSDSSQYAGDPWCGPLAMTDLPLCTTIKITNK